MEKLIYDVHFPSSSSSVVSHTSSSLLKKSSFIISPSDSTKLSNTANVPTLGVDLNDLTNISPNINSEPCARHEHSPIVMTYTLLPPYADASGNAFGGHIMSNMDICAGIAAKKHCSKAVVTASMDDLYFRNTAKVGDVITIKAKVNRTFRTSMEVGIVVEAEDPMIGDSVFVCSGYFIFVAVDKQGKTIPIPELILQTEDEKLLSVEAEQRRQLRTQMKDDMKKFVDALNTASREETLFNKNLPYKFARESVTLATHLVLPSHANTLGVTFGGQIMAWMEGAASIAATRHSRKMCITVGVDTLHFLSPIQVGEAVIIKAKVNRAFRWTMEIGVKVNSENLITGEKKLCNDAFFTFLAVEDYMPTPVPQSVPETEKEKQSYHLALARRRWRIERKALFEYIEMKTIPNEQQLAKTFVELVKSAENAEGWEPMLDNDEENNNGIHLWCKDVPVLTISEERMCCMKGEIIIEGITSEKALELIVNLDNRLKWDAMYVGGTVIEEQSPQGIFLHLLGKASGQENSNLYNPYPLASESMLMNAEPRTSVGSPSKNNAKPIRIDKNDSSYPSLNDFTTSNDNSDRKSIDYCIFQCVQSVISSSLPIVGSNECKGLRYVISEQSSKHKALQKRNGFLRGKLFSPSGFVLFTSDPQDTQPMRTRIVYIMRQLFLGGEAIVGTDMVHSWEDFMSSLVALKRLLLSVSSSSSSSSTTTTTTTTTDVL